MFKKLFLLLLFLIILAALLLFGKNLNKGSSLVVNFLKSPEENLVYTHGRTNVLLLGLPGGQNYGDDLTDTIIFASINIKTGDTVMLSIPRDIWLETLKAKVNTAYHYGQFALARQAVTEVVGQPIHYTFLLDFESFVKAIDLVDGIKVKIDQPFDDYHYPLAGKENDECGGDPQLQCRYEHLHFDAGLQTMDGTAALKYVRSRNAEGEEGTDFARSQRQQKIISSLKEKIVSKEVLLNPGKLQALIEITKTYFKTDPALNDAELASFANLGLRFIRRQSTIRTLNLDTGSEESPGFLVNPAVSAVYDYQWVLAPRAGNWQEFQNYFKQKLSNGY